MILKKTLTAIVGLMFLVLCAVGFSSCSGSTSPDNTSTSKTFTSSSVNSHTHTITLDKADVQSPPAAGMSIITWGCWPRMRWATRTSSDS